MKKILRIPLLLVAMFLTSIPISAHNFWVDGIYYNITSSTNKTVAVTYQGNSYNSYTNEYTGSVTIPSSVTYGGTTYSVTSIGNQAFYSCSGLTSVTIPNSVIRIDHYAFEGCSGLTSVTIPNSVTTIGYYAFSGCSSLTTVNFNATNCTSMGSSSYPVFSGCTKFTTLNIGDNVTNIPDYAFYKCTGLTSVTIPNSVTTIGDCAFKSCSGMTEVNISDLSAWCKIEFDGVDANPLYYAKKLKLNGTKITKLVIPNDITQINNFAFYNCTGLTSVTIPNSVTSIGNLAFYNCTGLTSVTIPNSVTSIGNFAFYYCI